MAVDEPNQKERIISSIHDSSHFGTSRTIDMVSSKYYWTGLTNDVKSYVCLFMMSIFCCKVNTQWNVIDGCIWMHTHNFVLNTETVYVCIYHMQVRSCDVCQKNNHKLQKASGTLHPIPVPSKIRCQVGMDLIGPMPATSRGNTYIITLTDYFSKWAEAAPLSDKTAQGVANFIYSVSHKSCSYHNTRLLSKSVS